MKISKKIALCLSIFVTMLIAFVIGVVGNVDTKVKTVEPAPQITKHQKVQYALDTSMAVVKRGSSNIEFSYTPDMIAKGTPVMYKYVFNNPMNDVMAVNLKSMNEITGITISYAYSTDGDESKLTESSAPFELQKINNNGTQYIYIVMTPNAGEEVPSTFMTSVKWYQGKLGTYSYVANGTSETFEIVSGQYIDEPPTVESTTVHGWYSDADYETEATFPIKAQDLTLYAVTNAEYNGVLYEVRGNTYYKAISIVDGSDSEFTLHNDTVVIGSDMQSDMIYSLDLSNCTNLTTIEDGAFGSAGYTEGLDTINLQGCSKLKYIGDGAFCPNYVEEMNINLIGCTSLEYIGDAFDSDGFGNGFTKNITIDFSELTELTHLGTGLSNAFLIGEDSYAVDIDLRNCTKLTEIGACAFENVPVCDIILPSSVKIIGDYAFANSSFLSITLPSSLLVIGSYAFSGCEFQDGFMLTIPNSVRLIGYGFLADAYAYGQFGVRMKSADATFNCTTRADAYYKLYQALQNDVKFSTLGIGGNKMFLYASAGVGDMSEFTDGEIWETYADGGEYCREGEYYSALLYRD